jgi:hypothetical protein
VIRIDDGQSELQTKPVFGLTKVNPGLTTVNPMFARVFAMRALDYPSD